MRSTARRLVLLTALASLAPAANADGKHRGPPPEPVPCVELATNPENGLVGARGIKAVNSQIIAASGPNVAHCQVDILYGENPNQNINIRVGLPLNSDRKSVV